MKKIRPLGPGELRRLGELTNDAVKNLKWMQRALVISTLAVIVLSLLLFSRLSKPQWPYAIIALVIFIMLIVLLPGEMYVSYRKKLKDIMYVKQQNAVTSIIVLSNKYYMLEEELYEGVHYLFQLDDNRVLSFGGQSFYPDDNFPSDNFEIVEAKGLKDKTLFIELYSHGKKIQPLNLFPLKEKTSLLKNPQYPDPKNFTIVKGSIEEVINSCVLADS